MIFIIDLLQKPKLYLTKPDRNIIADLSNQAFNIQYNCKLGNISELSFDLPLYIEIENELVYNKHLNMIRYKYLIKFEYNNKIEWFIIQKPIQNMGEDIDSFQVECFSLPFKLKDNLIRGYKVESKTLSQIMTDLLKETTWSLGYVNSEFDTKFRMLEITSATVLDAIFTVSETFSAIIKWDTENKKISFYKLDQIGNYTGLNFNYGIYLKSLNQSLDDSDFCTRLKIYGKSGLSINEYNITGTDYLDNFGYFLYPYTEDEQGNVIQSSHYMSNELCHALLAYNKKLQDNDGIYQGYLSQLETYEAELIILNSQLITLQSELIIIQDNIDLAQSKGQSAYDLLAQQSAKQNEINNKNTEISNKQSQINSVQSNIISLGDTLRMESNFTQSELFELTDYIVVKTVENQYIFDAKELLSWGKEQFVKINTPQILIEIDSINIDQYLDEDCQLDKGKLILGDLVRIDHETFDISIMAKIIEMDFDFEENSVNLVISNIENINRDYDLFLKRINQAVSTSTTVDMEKYKWSLGENANNEVQKIINNAWDATKQAVIACGNETVITDRRGISIIDPNDSDKFIRMMHGVITLTQDGGNTFHTAILPDRIVAERILGTLLIGQNLIIDASNNEGKKFFTVNETGVKISGLSLQITDGGLPVSELAEGVLLENKLYNGVKIDITDGLTITRSDNKVRSISNATDGFTIEKYEGSQWNKKLYADIDGNLILKGHMQIGSGNAIFKADTNGIYLGSSNYNYAPFRVSLSGHLVATSADIQGNIDCSSLKIAGTNVLDSLNKINGNYLSNGSVGANKLKVNELIVGDNIQMGPNAYIAWGKVIDKPTDLVYSGDLANYVTNTALTTQLGKDYVITGKIYANQITAGDFTAFNSLQIGGKNSSNKEILMYTTSGHNVIISAGGSTYPHLQISANQVLLGDEVYVGSSWYGAKRVLVEGDAISSTAVFG